MLLWYGPNGDDTTDDGGERLVCANKCKRGSEEVVSLFGPFQIRKGAVIVSFIYAIMYMWIYLRSSASFSGHFIH